MTLNVAQKLISNHLVEGTMKAGEEIGLRVDQTLTQDATGTLVMLELEAMQVDRVRTELSAQYVDHNLLQEDHRNPDDHLFLKSACDRFGVWYSRPGNGVSHPVHQERFGVPGKSLLGSDSHTCAAGAIGMLAMGAGGLEVAMAMAGFPVFIKMPEIWGIELKGELPDWVSAKDVILEMLRRHGVKAGLGRLIEYHGDGLECLSAMDRHVIANMGAELGATASVFPSDHEVRRFLRSQGREDSWIELVADSTCYDVHDEIDLSQLEPLIAMPSSPGNVRPVREVAGEPIYQAYVGSSANPGYRDFAVVSEVVREQRVDANVSLDINPTSRQILEDLARDGHLATLIRSGARIHQAGCNGCIGMGQAPASGKLSLRTVPRNFPGRSGTEEDQVCLVSPETAAASASRGVVTDPRQLDMPYPVISAPVRAALNQQMMQAPKTSIRPRPELAKGPNIKSIPNLAPLPDHISCPVMLKVGDDVSTDEILPAGANVLPYRSNIPKISEFVFEAVDSDYHKRALRQKSDGGHIIVAGQNYGQGSSREHAALAPRYLGLRVVIAKGFARIHWQNLINFGIVPLELEDEADYDSMVQGQVLKINQLRRQLKQGPRVVATSETTDRTLRTRHGLSPRQVDIILSGALINWVRANKV